LYIACCAATATSLTVALACTIESTVSPYTNPTRESVCIFYI
jgi:hypothetical protein